LWKVKHLIKIEPIIFPHGEPTSNDINHTFLKENGECIVIKEINPAYSERIEAAEKFKKDVKQLDGYFLRKDTRLKWLNYW
jgi:large subunit ribosomal protein L30